jgi:hypothetical protein
MGSDPFETVMPFTARISFSSWHNAGAHVRAREGAARGVGVPASDRAGVWGGAPR